MCPLIGLVWWLNVNNAWYSIKCSVDITETVKETGSEHWSKKLGPATCVYHKLCLQRNASLENLLSCVHLYKRLTNLHDAIWFTIYHRAVGTPSYWSSLWANMVVTSGLCTLGFLYQHTYVLLGGKNVEGSTSFLHQHVLRSLQQLSFLASVSQTVLKTWYLPNTCPSTE